MAKRKEKASNHTKLYGVCENKCLVEVMSKEESNQKLMEAKSYTDTKTSEIQTNINNTITPQLNNKADKNLGNVANGDFLNKMKTNGFIAGGRPCRFLAQPKILISKAGVYQETATVNNINGGKGIFYISNYASYVNAINGKSGSVFKYLGQWGFTAQNTLFASESNNGLLFIDGVNKAFTIELNKNSLSYVDAEVLKLDSLSFYGKSGSPNIYVYKIAEFL